MSNPIYFDNVDVLINNTGIWCNNASINTNNSLEPIYSIGKIGTHKMAPNGPTKHTFSFSYLVGINQDPNFEIISGLKQLQNEENYKPITVEINGITGFAYLTSYSFGVRPNDLIQANVTYDSFLPLSGNFSEQQYSGDYKNHENIAHGNTTYLSTDQSYSEFPIYELNYQFQAEWNPKYTLTKHYPVGVNFMGASERIGIEKDSYTKIEFSGAESTSSFLAATTTGLHLMALNAMCYSEYGQTDKPTTGNYTNMAIDLSGFTVTETNVAAQINDLMANNVVLERYH